MDRAIAIPVDRVTLAKRRWRATAADGRDFGFDLDHPLHDGAVVHCEGAAGYVIVQTPEPILEIALPSAPDAAARLAWQIGNLHFPIEIADGLLRVADDPALRQLLDRERVPCAPRDAVFHPIATIAHHH